MSMLSNIFNSRTGSPIPDVHVNSKAFNNLAIVKRVYDQYQTTITDLNRVKHIQPVVPFNQGFSGTAKVKTEGQGDLAEFISSIGAKQGLAKPSWFKVFITSPHTSGVERAVSLFCDQAQFPSINIMTAPIRTYGVPIQLPYMKTYDDIRLSFLVDTNFEIKQFFDLWCNLIVDDTEKGTNDVGFLDSYASTIFLFQLSPIDSNTIYTTTLLNAYPKLVDSMDLRYSARDEWHKLSVSFTYSKMITSEVTVSTALTTPFPKEVMEHFGPPIPAGYDQNRKNPLTGIMDKPAITASNLQASILNKASLVKDSLASFMPSSITSVFGR